MIGRSKLIYQNKAKYLGLIFDKNLTWKDHINFISKKRRKKVGLLKTMCQKHNLPQDTAISLYKSIQRPLLEYGSEVWGDTCQTNLKKLDSIENLSLTTALGVNKLSKTTEVNLEAKVLPLRLRMKRKLIRTYQRSIGTELEAYTNSSVAKRLKESRRKSYPEKVIETVEKLGITLETAKLIKTQDLDKLLIEEWKVLVERRRKKESIFHRGKYILKYKVFTRKRSIARIWHQARLNVIPTQAFLFKLKCAKDNKCKFDNEEETNSHFLLKCAGYKREFIQKEAMENHSKEDHDSIQVLLNEDRPPPIKRKISTGMLVHFKRRKMMKIDISDE
jgi:hypothetical protein